MPTKKGAGNRAANAKKDLQSIPDSEYIVFGNGKKDKKKRKDESGDKEQDPVSNKPTVKQIIGGASWTGKLPVNLLSEHCQKQKWNKPDYDMRTIPGRDGAEKMYRSSVTLSKTDAKTRELVTLPPLRLPQDHSHLSDQASALEARHFAATYALFRVLSMKNVHMTLPPKYRDLWKGQFSQLKKSDVSEGRSWKYDEDPFAAEAKRQEIQRSIEKRAAEQSKDLERNRDNQNSAIDLPHRKKELSKTWERAPHVEMGLRMRSDIESLVREHVTWNLNGIRITPNEYETTLAEMKSLGFRSSHAAEALEYCKDREEVLEWLMIHVPEDDLPTWALPANYSTGLSLVSGDLVKEAKLKRLAQGGYPTDLCDNYLQQFQGNETIAARALQADLVPELSMSVEVETTESPAWVEEMQTLEAIFGDSYSPGAPGECTIRMENVDGRPFTLCFKCPAREYPTSEVPIISLAMHDLPSYIKLSATRQAVLHAHETCLGEVMVYNICQWFESTLLNIIENPGRLSELRQLTLQARPRLTEGSEKGKMAIRPGKRGRLVKQSLRDKRSDEDILNLWKTRQETSAQQKMFTSRQNLPAWAKQDQIIETIANHQVTIVSGETGSGKSTQTVQFILDDAIQHMIGTTTNILCTQPRRVATLALADRVSNERCSQIGDEVGYVIRGETRLSQTTKITFMTTGVLLRRLQGEGGILTGLQGVSHVVIDEVHERSLDTDFLLALLKDCMKERPDLKILLMSATLDADAFTSYFGGTSKVGKVHIEGRTFPVTDLYVDDVLTATGYGGFDQEANIGKVIQSLGIGINYDLIRNVVEYIDAELDSQPGSILIFLPGTYEIDRCLESFRSQTKIYGLPLHASLLPAEQRKVFPAAPMGKRKVIAATNVAETSITIEDIVAVIDTGRVKETTFDAVNNVQRLDEVWASQAACKQRRGRAGRIRAGKCYKLFTRQMEMQMPVKPLPEISRVPLEQLCLSVKATGTGKDIATFLSSTITPPNASAVSSAVRNLQLMGALQDDQLTALGKYLSMIPADLRCAKLLVYGALFDCLEPCLTIASILTAKSPFVSPRDKRDEASDARRTFPNTHGDLLLDMAAFDEWTEISHRARSREITDWCSSKFLSQQTLRDISSGRTQLLDSLKSAGLVPMAYRSPQVQIPTIADTQKSLLLRAVLVGSLQPQVAMIQFPQKKYIASLSGAKELDPEARTIKFFVPDESHADATGLGNSAGCTASSTTFMATGSGGPAVTNETSATDAGDQVLPLTRVFLHPSSSLFTAQNFAHHATHLSYFTKVHTSKLFIRDVTPLNIYSLLLFGGKLEINTSGLGLVVGNTWRVRGWARIGVLINRLRVILDEELRSAVEDDGYLTSGGDSIMSSLGDSRAVAVVKKLIYLNGQDK